MRRLVYAPRAYAFIKNSDGEIRDVSKYITSGSVTRLLMQVSSAELTLRNPKMIFTTPDSKGGVAFSPMDPITIFLKRVHGRPVRVFTGFLDRVPYITLYPGTVQLRASCTLKRLLYTFFDPALPYTQSFLAKYGWLNLGDGSVYSPTAWREQPTKTVSGKVLYVGDSLGVGTTPYLEKLTSGNKLTTKVEVGKNSLTAAHEVESLIKTATFTYVVFDAGTNDANAAALSASLDIVKAVAKGLPILVPTVNGPDKKNKNTMLRNYPGIILVDWAKNGQVGSDGIHADAAGYKKRAELVYSALRDNSTNDASTESAPASNLSEGSFSTLLFETLKQIGHWDPDTILIEKLPSDLFVRMSELYMEITADQAELKTVVDDLMRKIVGEGDFGGDNNGSVDLSGIDGTVPETVYKVGLRMKVSEKFLLAAMMTGLVEAPIDGGKSFGNPKGGDLTGVAGAPTTRQSAGWRQETVASYPGVDRNDVPKSAERFYNECKQLDHGQSASDLAADVQRPAAEYRGRYAEVRDTAVTLLRKLEQSVGKEADSTDFGAPDLGGLPSGPAKEKSATRRDGRTNKGATGSTKLSSPLQKLDANTIGVGGGAYGAPRSYGGHAGVDMPASFGQTIYSITDGVVVYAGSWGSEGQLTVIRSTQKVNNYPDGIRIGYGHMSALSLSKGDEVSAGDPIGKAGHGSNGQNHLHLWIRQDDQPTNGTMDPTPLAKAAAAGEQPSGGPGSSTPSGGGTNDPTDVTNFGGAQAFASTFNFPTLMESIEAEALQGEKSLMNDKPLMPFIQQLCEASLREFQSMPDGSFFAFYPDYFGEMYHRPPYWNIDDIEILDGKVELSDDSLTTHYYVVGDTSGIGNEQMNRLLSAGVVTVFNAFMTGAMLTQDQKSAKEEKKGKEKGPSDLLLSADEAAAFLNRYGARPQVDTLPMIRHPYFEMFLAYQRFMLAWSKQFSTPFSFTFMPELYPGGKVGFPDHSLQMYIEEVTHTFDYTSGFTTTATLSAPSVYAGKGAKIEASNLPPRMVKAIIEPATSESND
jgi:murein DD-endopeptidase MepM/ murein hydrolase activator NlpD